MSTLSIVHALAALVALAIGLAIVSMRKGDRRHRVLGWLYVSLMAVGLVAILAVGADHPRPFHAYSVVILLGLGAAVLVSRRRASLPQWRGWHGAIMSFSMLGAFIALGGIVGGIAIGAGNGPRYYQMFNVVIAIFSLLGLWLIATRPAIWGTAPGAPERATRTRFLILALTVSGGLIVSQWALLQ